MATIDSRVTSVEQSIVELTELNALMTNSFIVQEERLEEINHDGQQFRRWMVLLPKKDALDGR